MYRCEGIGVVFSVSQDGSRVRDLSDSMGIGRLWRV